MSLLIKTQRQSGFTYVEIMITVAVIAIAILPIMDALQTSAQASGYQRQHVALHYHLMGGMESVLAESYTALEAEIINSTTASSFSDASGTSDRRLVYLSKYDIDNVDLDNDVFTGTDDVIWVKTELEGTNHSFETLVIP